MIPSTEVNHATVGRHQATLAMGIDPSAFAHLMGVLTNLYSDKALAVVREYSTNAYDSHVLAGQARPIEVTLPIVGSRTPTFRVQDFGVGLSFDELRDVYAQYGASTKRVSNDVNGMLGLGCKSALTYASSFTITSVKDGNKVMAVISKDAQGLGAIKVLADLPTTESNGVTIEIPVVANAVRTFRDTAMEFYRSWEPGTVLIDGENPADEGAFFYRQTKDGSGTVWLTPNLLVVRGAPYGSKSYVVMGNVAYPHDFNVSGCTIRAWVNIGEVDFTPSREALHYTERTNGTIKKIKADFGALLAKRVYEVADKGTEFEKNNVLYFWTQSINVLSAHRPRVTTDPQTTFKVSGDKATRYKRADIDWRVFQDGYDLVSDFPFKSVGPTHKGRLAERFNRNYVILFPPSADLSAIQGHPRLVSWSDVVKATSKPAPKKRQTTIYTARKSDQTWDAENFGTGAVVYYTSDYVSRCPEIWQVVLKTGQIDRFRKLHPLSKPVQAYLNDQYKAAQDALTDDDKLAAAIQRGYLPGPFSDPNFLSASPVLVDPLLRRVIGLARYSSATLTRAANLGVTIPDQDAIDAIVQEISDRYPLLNAFNSCMIGSYYNRVNVTGELVLYLNAKYNELIANANGKKA